MRSAATAWVLAVPLAAATAVTSDTLTAQTEPCYVDDMATQVECGNLEVPLDYTDPSAGSLSVGFVVLPSYSTSSDAAPLFMLAGGPGQSATSLAARSNDMFAEVRSTRDIVLVDQRGTGRSAALQCEPPDPQDLAPQYDLFDPEEFAACVAALPAGIEHFTTANAIRDFESVREHLGYGQINIYGGSYGSRAGFAYLALAGDSVRAAVLDAIAPPSVPIGLFGVSAAQSFALTLGRCAAIDGCAAAFPRVREDFLQVDAALREAPVETRIPHPTTGQLTDFRLWHSQFIGLLRFTLYSPDSAALLPLLITQAAGGNYLPLAALTAAAATSVDVNPMLNLTIICNEDWPRVSEERLRSDGENSFAGDSGERYWREACGRMPRFEVDLGWMDAGPFPQPALLLSGAADPVTPPSNGEIAASRFQHARHVVAKEAAHIVAASDCGGDLVAQFLENPDPAALDTGCLEEMPAQRFRLDTMGSFSVAGKGVDAP